MENPSIFAGSLRSLPVEVCAWIHTHLHFDVVPVTGPSCGLCYCMSVSSLLAAEKMMVTSLFLAYTAAFCESVYGGLCNAHIPSQQNNHWRKWFEWSPQPSVNSPAVQRTRITKENSELFLCVRMTQTSFHTYCVSLRSHDPSLLLNPKFPSIAQYPSLCSPVWSSLSGIATSLRTRDINNMFSKHLFESTWESWLLEWTLFQAPWGPKEV